MFFWKLDFQSNQFASLGERVNALQLEDVMLSIGAKGFNSVFFEAIFSLKKYP